MIEDKELPIIAIRIKQAREDRGLTQKALGDLLNISKQTISNYETGERTPDINTLAKLAKTFEVTSDYLIGNSDFETAKETIPIAPEIIEAFMNIITEIDNNRNKFLSFKNCKSETHPKDNDFYILESRRLFAPLITSKYFKDFSTLISACRWVSDDVIKAIAEEDFENKYKHIQDSDIQYKDIHITYLKAQFKSKTDAVEYYRKEVETVLKFILDDIKEQKKADPKAFAKIEGIPSLEEYINNKEGE